MPHSLPQRSGGFRDYEKDAPITVFGCMQARLVGECPGVITQLAWPHVQDSGSSGHARTLLEGFYNFSTGNKFPQGISSSLKIYFY